MVGVVLILLLTLKSKFLKNLQIVENIVECGIIKSVNIRAVFKTMTTKVLDY